MGNALDGPPLVSVIIPNWNGRAFLGELFNSLKLAPPGRPRQIIVVDNGSTDGSPDWIRHHFPEALLIAQRANQGFAQAVNRGLAEARGEFIALVNNDTSWGDDWIAPCAEFLSRSPGYDFAAPLVLNHFQRDLIDGAGDALNRRLMPYRRGFGLRLNEFPVHEQDLIAASCSAVLFRPCFFERAGLFDEDFFMYLEDIDLFLRGLLLGMKGRLLPSAAVFHREGGSIVRLEQQRQADGNSGLLKSRLMVRNRVFFLVKNCPLGYALAAWPLLAAELVRSFLYHCKRGEGWIFLKAHVEAIPLLIAMWTKRKHIQRNRTISLVGFYRALLG